MNGNGNGNLTPYLKCDLNNNLLIILNLVSCSVT